ncbi:nitric oxide synthase, inducible, partial [Sigmodon hispidus]
HPEEDHLYQEEMQEMVHKGGLHQVHTGYSRVLGKPKPHDVRMAWDGATTLKKLVATKVNLSEEQVEDYFFQLKV